MMFLRRGIFCIGNLNFRAPLLFLKQSLLRFSCDSGLQRAGLFCLSVRMFVLVRLAGLCLLPRLCFAVALMRLAGLCLRSGGAYLMRLAGTLPSGPASGLASLDAAAGLCLFAARRPALRLEEPGRTGLTCLIQPPFRIFSTVWTFSAVWSAFPVFRFPRRSILSGHRRLVRGWCLFPLRGTCILTLFPCFFLKECAALFIVFFKSFGSKCISQLSSLHRIRCFKQVIPQGTPPGRFHSPGFPWRLRFRHICSARAHR